MKSRSEADRGLVLITGANGFLGRHLCRHFSEEGYRVRALVRNPAKTAELSEYATGGIYRCDLPSNIDQDAFDGNPFAVIHCAFTTNEPGAENTYDTNVNGSQALLDLTRSLPYVPFVFISSLSAQESAQSAYGKQKFQVEQLLDSEKDLVIRPGLIVGAGGLFERMRRSVVNTPLVPLFYGGKQKIQVVRVEELCRAIETALGGGFRGNYSLAASPPWKIRDFYKEIARLDGKRCRFIPLPGALSLQGLRLLEALGLKLPINSENLLGLKNMKFTDTVKDCEILGLSLSSSLETGQQNS